MKFDDLQSTKDFSYMSVYGQSKSANVLFALKLGKMLEGTEFYLKCSINVALPTDG